MIYQVFAAKYHNKITKKFNKKEKYLFNSVKKLNQFPE
jgi:hypothetical protein